MKKRAYLFLAPLAVLGLITVPQVFANTSTTSEVVVSSPQSGMSHWIYIGHTGAGSAFVSQSDGYINSVLLPVQSLPNLIGPGYTTAPLTINIYEGSDPRNGTLIGTGSVPFSSVSTTALSPVTVPIMSLVKLVKGNSYFLSVVGGVDSSANSPIPDPVFYLEANTTNTYSDGQLVWWNKYSSNYSTYPTFDLVFSIFATQNGQDSTAPATTEQMTPAPNSAGWNNSPTQVVLSATDNADGSGVASITYTLDGETTTVQGNSTTVDVSTDGKHSLTYYATDVASNQEPPNALNVNVDTTPPTVNYVGNAGTYTVDQQVDIKFSATDSLSAGVNSTGTDINVAAYTLGLGSHTYTAQATDAAGNVGTGSVTFTVTVDNSSLGNVVRTFVANKGVASGLVSKLSSAAAADKRGNTTASNNEIQAFIHQVEAQSGKSMTANQADMLITFAQALLK